MACYGFWRWKARILIVSYFMIDLEFGYLFYSSVMLCYEADVQHKRYSLWGGVAMLGAGIGYILLLSDFMEKV